MKAEDLSNSDKFFLNFCLDSPYWKYIGVDRLAMNTLSSYGLVKDTGNMQYELTEEGKALLKQASAYETSSEIPSNYSGKSAEPVV